MQSPIPKNINENFYKWFNGSKATDDTGKPIIFFHKSRSKNQFVNFDASGVEKNPYNRCYGIYFAAWYHKHLISYIADGLEYFVFLKYNNPFIFYETIGSITDSEGEKHQYIDTNEEFCKKIQSKGYDAIIVYNNSYINEYIVFSNSQIKSIDNNGQYSNDNNIYE